MPDPTRHAVLMAVLTGTALCALLSACVAPGPRLGAAEPTDPGPIPPSRTVAVPGGLVWTAPRAAAEPLRPTPCKTGAAADNGMRAVPDVEVGVMRDVSGGADIGTDAAPLVPYAGSGCVTVPPN